MEDMIILIVLMVCALGSIAGLLLTISTNRNVREMAKTLTFQYNLIVKMQNLLKNKMSVNDTTDKAEIIYQDLLQDLIPIMAAIDIIILLLITVF